MEDKFFKLAPGQGVFWDPTQSKVENQKLVGDQIKELEITSAVAEAKRNERIIAVGEKEAAAYFEANGIPVDEDGADAKKGTAKKTAAKN